jgi:hypothetical protein
VLLKILGVARMGQSWYQMIWRKGDENDRGSIGLLELESAILQAVKVAPGCSNFVGVVVRLKNSKSPSEPNWDVRGVRFGKADRTLASGALATVVARLQQEFQLQLEPVKFVSH